MGEQDDLNQEYHQTKMQAVDHVFAELELEDDESLREVTEEHRIEYAVGKCASCGAVVYPGECIIDCTSESFLQHLGIAANTPVSICEACTDGLEPAEIVTLSHNIETDYYDLIGASTVYVTESVAIREATPNSRWKDIVADRVTLDRQPWEENLYIYVMYADDPPVSESRLQTELGACGYSNS